MWGYKKRKQNLLYLPHILCTPTNFLIFKKDNKICHSLLIYLVLFLYFLYPGQFFNILIFLILFASTSSLFYTILSSSDMKKNSKKIKGTKKMWEGYNEFENGTKNVKIIREMWRYKKWKKIILIPSSHSSYHQQSLNILIFKHYLLQF